MKEFQQINRRQTLLRLGGGFGALALGAMLREDGAHGAGRVEPAGKIAPRRQKTKAVIQLFMHGGPSHVDLLDPKPMLNKYHGKKPPGEVVDDENRTKYLLGTPFNFRKHGECGTEFSELLPNIAQHADDIAVIRSMFTEHRNHEQACWMSHTGMIMPGRPTVGAWATYALGTENQDLPGYVVLPDPAGLPVDGIRNWSNGWLPPLYQGTVFRSLGTPVLNLKPGLKRSAEVELGRLDLLRSLNRNHKRRYSQELELDARISNLELAARMQMAATDVMDIKQESPETHRLYGIGNSQTDSYGRRCLMARRLVERGVRFVQLFMKYQPWDTHTDNVSGTRGRAGETDLPVAGLLTDLKRRGLLDSTLVMWGGEFGRTPGAELRNDKVAMGHEGRDHHPYGFSIWLAGGGIRGGQVYGATDDFGYRSVVNRTQTANVHATILHLMGLDHEEVTYFHNGRDERLTDVYDARVIEPLLA